MASLFGREFDLRTAEMRAQASSAAFTSAMRRAPSAAFASAMRRASSAADEVEAAFANLVGQPISAILAGSDPLIFEQGARASLQKGPTCRARPASPFSFRGLAPIAAVIPVRMRIDSEHAIDAANHPTSRSANNPTNKATDRSEHAVTGISTAVSPVVHPPRHALRLCGDRRGEKEADSNHTEHSHLVSLFFYVTPNRVSRCWPLFGNK
jgi:hypothetical protein